MVLATFNESLLTLNQTFNLLNSILISLLNFCKLSPDLNKLVSSAKRISFNNLETLQISLIYNINSRGPSTEPCGTPHNTDDNWDEEFPSETLFSVL